MMRRSTPATVARVVLALLGAYAIVAAVVSVIAGNGTTDVYWTTVVVLLVLGGLAQVPLWRVTRRRSAPAAASGREPERDRFHDQ